MRLNDLYSFLEFHWTLGSPLLGWPKAQKDGKRGSYGRTSLYSLQGPFLVQHRKRCVDPEIPARGAPVPDCTSDRVALLELISNTIQPIFLSFFLFSRAFFLAQTFREPPRTRHLTGLHKGTRTPV